MKNHNSEDIFEQLARTYTEHRGEQLRNEQHVLPPYSSDRLDQLTFKRIQAMKIHKFIRIAGIAAACLVLVMIPVLYQQVRFRSAELSDSAPKSTDDSYSKEALIPLSFSLPDHMSVAQTKEDNGISTYYLDNTRQDNVVLQLEHFSSSTEISASLKPITIEGKQAYGLSTADYKILRFEHEDIQYTLTCRYDINTLIELSKNIF